VALTNAALTYTRGGKPEEAVKVYGILVDRYPMSQEAANAAWSAGKLYEQAALWDQAAKYYEILADKFPKDQHAADALFNAGLLREHLGDPKAAINSYTEYTKRYKTRDDVREVAFRVGVVYADAGQREQSARAFLEFAQKYPGGPQAIEALSRAGQAYVELGQDHRAQDPLAKAVALYKKSQDKSAAKAAAHARYLEGEAVFHQFERLQLASEPRKLKKTLDEKSQLLEKSKAVYIDVVTFNDPEWATAALYRIGEAYERFSKALRDTPTPTGLNAEEQQVYRDELEKVVVVVEEKAIDSYKGGYAKALQLGVYNDFTHKLREALGRLDEQEFPKEAEARARPGAASPRIDLPFVGSVER
jgi:tetratricopeptide (TPR) repeat protein